MRGRPSPQPRRRSGAAKNSASLRIHESARCSRCSRNCAACALAAKDRVIVGEGGGDLVVAEGNASRSGKHELARGPCRLASVQSAMPVLGDELGRHLARFARRFCALRPSRRSSAAFQRGRGRESRTPREGPA